MSKYLGRLCALGASILVGCGGGGSDAGTTTFNSVPEPSAPSGGPPPPPVPQTSAGLWVGKTSTLRSIAGLILPDGTYYFIYSSPNVPSLIGGVTQGTSTRIGASVVSTDGRDFNLEGFGIGTGSLTAQVISKKSLVGTVRFAGNTTLDFSATYDAAFEQTATIATIAGSFSGRAASSSGVQSAVVTIAESGVLSGTVSGCRFTGTAAPRSDANAFGIDVTFAGAPCLFANQTLSGIAYYDAPTGQLIALAPNVERTDGFLFVATRP